MASRVAVGPTGSTSGWFKYFGRGGHLFQPSLRAFDSAGFAAVTDPQLAATLRRPAPKQFAGLDFADLDLVVDLGENIGSASWWRGLATLGVLVTSTLLLGARVTPLPEPVRAPLLPAQEAALAPNIIAPLGYGATTGQLVAPTARVQALAETPERPRIEVVARLGAVDSMQGALRRAGVGQNDVATVIELTNGAIDVRRLKPGTSFDLVLGRRENKSVPRPLESLAFRAAFDLKLEVNRAESGELVLKRIPIKVDNTPLRVTGTVGSSLYKSARAAGIPARAVADYIKALSYGLDFQRDVKGKDRFDIVVEHRRAETGETETGGLIYAGLDKGNKKIELMRWTAGGKTQFFLADGSSAKKGLMKTPVDGARLTSGFGFRTHPILGYSRLHKGVDFGAASGTPIMAAAAGTVDFAGRHGGHGNYVRIRHQNGIATAYAHMSRFAVRKGAKVQQGQVIGYVGSTGMSTGPHLHYEVYVNGKAVDPRSAKFSTGYQLTGGELSRFKAELNRMRNLRATNGAADAKTDALAEADKKDEKRG